MLINIVKETLVCRCNFIKDTLMSTAAVAGNSVSGYWGEGSFLRIILVLTDGCYKKVYWLIFYYCRTLSAGRCQQYRSIGYLNKVFVIHT